jgi:hypothetical protein
MLNEVQGYSSQCHTFCHKHTDFFLLEVLAFLKAWFLSIAWADKDPKFGDR